ncbi:hypothetical protein ACGC1H_000997 [Rhizoctonia solani]
MRRSGSKSILKRVVEKALPNALLGRNSPEYSSANVPKSIKDKDHDTAPQGIIISCYMPHTITLKSQPDLGCGYHKRQTCHSDTDVKPPHHRRRANTLSIQTNPIVDKSSGNTGSPTKRLNLDKFIRRIESWTPPSPREVLARRLFREVQRATNTRPQTTLHQPSTGGYLVHRRIKAEPTF